MSPNSNQPKIKQKKMLSELQKKLYINGLTITADTIKVIEGVSKSTAYNRLNYLKDIYNKQVISIPDYERYLGTKLIQLLDYLK